MTLKPRINIVTLGVTDMPRARAFYEALGWPLEAEQSNEQVSFFRGTNVVLGLFGASALAQDANVKAEGHGFRAVTTAYNCGSEAEVDAAYAHAVSVGATALKQPQKVFWGGYSGYFADPDGHLWEVAYNPFFPMDDHGHIDFAAANADKSGDQA
ncbi:MAG: VOC family protein [Pseudomonadota bacterium]